MAKPTAKTHDGDAGGRGAAFGLFLLIGLVLAAGAWIVSTLPGPDGDDAGPSGGTGPIAFVGDRTCAECHPGASQAHEGSGHARTLVEAHAHPIVAQLEGQVVVDPERPESSWRYRREGDRFLAVREEGERVEEYILDYAMGSGHHAVTFVGWRGEEDGEPLGREHRLTYFTHQEGMGVTPGQATGPESAAEGRTPHGRELTAQETRICFGCHATRISFSGRDRFEPEALVPNVSCERCHGPGARHVEAARERRGDLAMPFGNGRASPEEEIRLCGECHRLPGMATPDAIRPDNPAIARFQPIGLMQSACYRRGEGRMTCTTCHDPHAGAEADRPAYESSCLSCHSGGGTSTDPAGGRACPVSPRSGCVECHMPRVETGQGLFFTDHWIRRRH